MFQSMKDKIAMNRNRDKDRTACQVFDLNILRNVIFNIFFSAKPLLESSPVKVSNSHGTTKYSKLENELDSPQRFVNDTILQQEYLTRQQNEHLEAISDSLGSLKTVSRHIGIELDEQAGYVL